jgi:hypothetical protein
MVFSDDESYVIYTGRNTSKATAGSDSVTVTEAKVASVDKGKGKEEVPAVRTPEGLKG